jgi:hypothetical protein
MATPTPVFPAAIATDAQLKVANNLVQTTLRVSVDSVNTILFTASTAGFTANCLVSIDKEIMAIASVVSAPNPSLIVATGGRGFDGTTAASHAAGAKVSLFIDAWHHNVLSAEVKAIETFLGPNGQNIGAASYLVVSTQYDFAAQTPGGSLVVGNNVITLSPVPKGVNGTDTNHYLYISGGTGVAEAVLITGGTAVSGAASGTVIVNCANAHSGAWTIRSATSGIKEAIVSVAGARVTVTVPAGSYFTYAPVIVTTGGVCITGVGRASRIVTQFTSGDAFFFNGNGSYLEGNALGDLAIWTKDAGVESTVTNSVVAVHLNWQYDFCAQNLQIRNVLKGVYMEGNVSIVRILCCNIQGLTQTTGIGIHQAAGADVYLTNNMILGILAAQPLAGIKVDYSTGTKISENEVFGTNFGLLMVPGDGQVVQHVESLNNWYDSGAADGAYIAPSGTGYVKTFRSSLDWFTGFTQNGVHTAGTGVIDSLVFVEPLIRNNTQYGIFHTAGINIEFIGATVTGNSYTTAGTYHGFASSGGAGGFKLLGGVYAQAGGSPNNQGYGIFITGNADNFVIQGVDVAPNISGGIQSDSTGMNRVVKDNLGASEVIATMASGASLALGQTGQTIFKITGTTQITTITGGYKAREISLVFTGAAPGGLGTGGNIARAQTAAQNQTIRLVFDGTSWF